MKGEGAVAGHAHDGDVVAMSGFGFVDGDECCFIQLIPRHELVKLVGEPVSGWCHRFLRPTVEDQNPRQERVEIRHM